MIKNSRKQVYIALLIVFGLFILSFLMMYFLYDRNHKNTLISQDVIDVDYAQENKVSLKNILPVSDELGKTFNGQGTEDGIQGYVEFEIKNISENKVDFEIYVTMDDSEAKNISSSFVKCFLTDENDSAIEGFETNKIPTYESLVVLDDKPNSKLLFKGSINSESRAKFKFRSWLADTYVISQNREVFDYIISVRVV